MAVQEDARLGYAGHTDGHGSKRRGDRVHRLRFKFDQQQLVVAGDCGLLFALVRRLDGRQPGAVSPVERPAFGYFIDHSCDAFATFLILAGLGLSPYVQLNTALFTLVGYLILFIHAVLAGRVLGELKLSYIAAGPTELRLALIAFTLAMLVLGDKPGSFAPISGFDIAIGAAGALLILLFLYQTLIVARRITVIECGS
jgi:hypothetical protein